MKNISFLIFLLLLAVSPKLLAQCDIKNKLLADGTMVYYFDPAVFYTTKSKSLKINIVTDKEHYFIALQPTPFPSKKVGKEIKDDLVVHLADQKAYTLSHYDTQYMRNDSIMQVLYLMDAKDVEAFSKFEAIVAEINMKGTEFIRDYNFKLHKDAIMEQLNCFLKKGDE
ncbi:hypothetical protein SAMN05444397_103130 [Flavobacterium aquidurense]|uniref:DUF4369 domain-containing protein n=1 Tax=Flavobacterium frigidimaris TaxID=262320 RepID=A0ABX4BUP4_FLAFR|nr:hypothetical protein [Flavobacterium frigidimaris]OXA81374.1 hypothetical protein B0A65_03720 [Flavobacterium frigidimaris]SDZ02786.1 hypothetical protein SAMN05444397_103130 [Flavobacterium aquidurense]